MSAEDLVKAGDLNGAMEALQADIRANPADAKLRIFLFQLLCIEGDWLRAVQQLKASAKLDPAAGIMAQVYEGAIACEIHREKVFAGQATPGFIGEPLSWLTEMAEALCSQAGGDIESAEALRTRALNAAPATPGSLNGTRFDWIADADPRLGPILEIIIDGRYVWLPFADIDTLTAKPPHDLRDLVWTPVTLDLTDGTSTGGLVPTRYPSAIDVPAHKLARATDWVETGGKVVAGLGQRMLCTEAEDIALLDLRTLDLTASGAETATGPVASHG